MGTRRHYPGRDCPACNAYDTVVKQTAYTPEGIIVRQRACYECEHTWWTQQPPELAINPDTHKVVLPSRFWGQKDKRKEFKIITI